MSARVDLRSYAGETSPPFTAAMGYTRRELDAAYHRGFGRGARFGIAWSTAIIGLGCGWLLWSAGVIDLGRIAGLLP